MTGSFNRLILRIVTLDDAENMFLNGSKEEGSKYVTWNPTKHYPTQMNVLTLY